MPSKPFAVTRQTRPKVFDPTFVVIRPREAACAIMGAWSRAKSDWIVTMCIQMWDTTSASVSFLPVRPDLVLRVERRDEVEFFARVVGRAEDDISNVMF